MLHEIVVGIDGSEASRVALRRALDLAAPDARVHLVTAYLPEAVHELASVRERLPEEFRLTFDPYAVAEADLDAASAHVASTGREVTTRFVDADPADAILDRAAEVDADAIVIGSRGLGPARRFFLGSVSTRVAHHAHRTLIVVHTDDEIRG